MANTTSYTDDATSLILDAWQKLVLSVIGERNVFMDMVLKHAQKTGEGVPWRLPTTRELIETSGGLKFTFPVRLLEMSTTKKLGSASESFSPQQVDQVMRAEYKVEQVVTDFAIFDKYADACQSDEAVVDFENEKIEGAIEEHINYWAKNILWAAPSATEPSPSSIAQACHVGATPGTGSTEYPLGGIDPSVTGQSGWACHAAVTSSFGTSNEGIKNISYLRTLVAAHGGRTDLIICTPAVHKEIVGTAFGRIQIGNIKDDFWGWPVLEGAAIVPDLNAYNQGTLGTIYGLDLRYVKWYVLPHKRADKAPAFCLLEKKDLPYQLGTAYIVVTEGNLCFLKRDALWANNITAA